jgi:hypothetical protein
LSTEVTAVVRGVHGRPWAPAHLTVRETAGGGWSLSWIARSRLDGDRWEGPETSADRLRFRVRWLDGEVEVGTAEVERTALEMGGPELAALFPAGLAAARVAVAQWGDGWGWGLEATIPLA